MQNSAKQLIQAQQESFKNVLDPDGNPEHHQNIIICSLAHYQHFLWSYLANRQRDEQTDKRWHNLLGGGNKNEQQGGCSLNLGCIHGYVHSISLLNKVQSAVGMVEFMAAEGKGANLVH